jgi:hypothetical protein
MRKNVAYFKVNYGIVGVGTTALVMFLNPWSLIVLAFLALVWGYAYVIRTGPLVLGGRELSDREKFLALSGGSLVVIFLLTSVGSTLFYALGLSALLVGLHAAMRVPGGRLGSGQGGSVAVPGCHGCLPSSKHQTVPRQKYQTCIVPSNIAFCLLLLLPADDLFLDEVPEQQSGGFLSLLTGGSRPAAAAVVASAV